MSDQWSLYFPLGLLLKQHQKTTIDRSVGFITVTLLLIEKQTCVPWYLVHPPFFVTDFLLPSSHPLFQPPLGTLVHLLSEFTSCSCLALSPQPRVVLIPSLCLSLNPTHYSLPEMWGSWRVLISEHLNFTTWSPQHIWKCICLIFQIRVHGIFCSLRCLEYTF